MQCVAQMSLQTSLIQFSCKLSTFSLLVNIFFYLLKTHCYLKHELCFKNHTGDLFEPQRGIPHRATSDTESCHEFASEL